MTSTVSTCCLANRSSVRSYRLSWPRGKENHLFNALEGKLVTLDEDLDGHVHELLRHVQHLLRHGGADQHHLGRGRQVPVDVVDLLLEALVEHLVRLIDHQHLCFAYDTYVNDKSYKVQNDKMLVKAPAKFFPTRRAPSETPQWGIITPSPPALFSLAGPRRGLRGGGVIDMMHGDEHVQMPEDK